MGPVRSYQDLIVWQKAMELAVEIYEITNHFPESERYGLSSQLQRSSTSVASNLAEGHALGLPRQFLKHIRIANGSLAEAETQLILAERLNYLERNRLERLLERFSEIRRMLTGLKHAIESKIPKP